jgi:hypothetical protein
MVSISPLGRLLVGGAEPGRVGFITENVQGARGGRHVAVGAYSYLWLPVGVHDDCEPAAAQYVPLASCARPVEQVAHHAATCSTPHRSY